MAALIDIVGFDILACRLLQVCPRQVVHRRHQVSRPVQGAQPKSQHLNFLYMV